MKYVIAVDLGATNLRVGIYSFDGELRNLHIIRTPSKGGKNTIAEVIYDISIKLLKDLGLSGDEVVGIGIGTIGPLDIRRGEVVNTPNLELRSFRLREPLIDLFNKNHVYVVNDCVAGVWGEKTFGHGVNYSNIVYVTISTGVGGGVVINDNLMLGKDGNAHEIGHLVVNYDDELRCGCGGVGHWEAYASGSGIPRFVKHYMKNLTTKHRNSIVSLEDVVTTPEEFFNRVRTGSKLFNDICYEICKINAAGLASIVNAYDPELITIGGSVALANYGLIIEPAVKLLKQYSLNRLPEIKPTKLGSETVLKGAASLVIKPPKTLLEIYGT